MAASSAGSFADSYHLDKDRAWALVVGQEYVPATTRVEVFLTGPKVGFDEYLFSWLPSGKPGYSTTNSVEIEDLLGILRKKTYGTNTPAGNFGNVGYTYHILFYQDEDKTVIHYYVFDVNLTNDVWCTVLPRSKTGSNWSSDEIGAWLHKRVEIPRATNPATDTSATNAPHAIK